MFICCYHKQLKAELLNFNRLYAFPNIPDINNKKIILDSGAFALSKSGKRMDAKYINSLAIYYKKYGSFKNVFCIAPDVFKNAKISMIQFENFMKKYCFPVVPVIQFSDSSIDLFNTKKQIIFYSEKSLSGMVCISNNKFDPIKQFEELRYIVNQVKKVFKNIWIHVLGAGYSHNNIKDWLKIGVDSMDSISYYTDASAGMEWRKNSYSLDPSGLSFRNLAIKNAQVANS